jgi:4-amino-4-deoxy-L-arabinose transferase-like glycosyltransferase
MLFDQPPSELPVARLHQRGRLPSISHALVAWLAARWQWLRPRTVPVIVAFIGMCAVMASAHYLSKLATQMPPPERLHVQVVPNVAQASATAAQPAPPSHYLLIDP